MKNFFVTGTDTGVGKTLVSQHLISYLVKHNKTVAPMKPVASGAFIQNKRLVNDDALILVQSANTHFDYSIVNPYVFKEPIAPHLAAKKNGSVIDIDHLNTCYQKLSSNVDCVVIEGAGGWQVPLTPSVSFADWVSQNKWPVVLVVGLRLGCINHARLTYFDILAKKNKLVGWVVNTMDDNLLASNAVIEDLRNTIQAPLLGVIPRLDDNLDAVQFLDFSTLRNGN